MRNFKSIMKERDRKIKEYEDSVRLNEKIEKQWNDIENNIDNAEINRDTKRLFICYGNIYEENKNKLINYYGFNNNNFNNEIFSSDAITKNKEYCTYYYLDGIDDNTTATEELNKNNIKTIDELHNKISNDINKDLNKLNEDFLDKYNLNDGQHSEESRIDDVFGKKTDNENNSNKIKYYSKEGDNIKEKYTKNYTVLNLNDGKGKLETYKDGRKISEQEINLKDDLSSYIKSKDFINKYIKLVNEIENEML